MCPETGYGTLLPEMATLYPETGDFVAENGNKVTSFRFCQGGQAFTTLTLHRVSGDRAYDQIPQRIHTHHCHTFVDLDC